MSSAHDWAAYCDNLAAQNKQLRAEIERLRSDKGHDASDARLRAALKPFADAVFNDNGDMTITPCSKDTYVAAYFAMRAAPPQAVETRRGEWRRAPERDKRIARGDDFSADAWRHWTPGEVKLVAIGQPPGSDIADVTTETK